VRLVINAKMDISSSSVKKMVNIRNILSVKYVGKKDVLIAKNLNANNVNFIIIYTAFNANILKVYNALYFTMMIEILLLDLKMV